MNVDELENIAEIIVGKKRRTLNDHYGVSEKELDEIIGEFLKDMYVMDNRAEVIDKHFAEIKDAKLRCKIHAYGAAMVCFKNLAK